MKEIKENQAFKQKSININKSRCGALKHIRYTVIISTATKRSSFFRGKFALY